MKFTFVSLENCATAAGVVIVIDVLRAFSSAAFAFEAGADSISLVGSVEEAVNLKNIHPDWIFMGELNCIPPLGFDLGNSPTQIRKLDLTGKKMIQRTSAGTQGVVRCMKLATLLLASSFVVASATVHHVMRNPPVEVTFVITGGGKNGEDLACADFLQSLFENNKVDQTQLIQRVYGSEDAERHLDPGLPEFPFTDLDYVHG